MDSASAIIELKVNYEQALHLAAGQVINSDAFSAGGYMWRINFYPRGMEPNKVKDESESCEGDLSICLKLVSNYSRVKAIFEVLLIDKHYGQPFYLVGLVTRQLKKPYDHKLIWNINSPDNTNDLFHKYVNDDGYIKLLCTVRVLTNKLIPVPPSDIAKHLGTLLDTADGSDVAFTVGGEMFHAHRAVLAARSPVFRAELLGSMAEATMPLINLHGIAPATFKVMLQFMYTDSFPGDDELGDAPTKMLRHLLAAADRYALDRLKLLCAEKLCHNMSVGTVTITLAYAEMYGCPELKRRCIGFFAVDEKNFKRAVLTKGFGKLVRKFPSIIDELRDGVET